MMNVETQIMSFRLSWLGRISDESDNMWKKMANFWFDQIGGLPLVLNCDYDEKILYYCKSKIPTFYCEILLAWYMCRVKGKVVMNTSPLQKYYGLIRISFLKRNSYFSRIGFKVVLCISKIFLEMALLEIVNKLGMN